MTAEPGDTEPGDVVADDDVVTAFDSSPAPRLRPTRGGFRARYALDVGTSRQPAGSIRREPIRWWHPLLRDNASRDLEPARFVVRDETAAVRCVIDGSGLPIGGLETIHFRNELMNMGLSRIDGVQRPRDHLQGADPTEIGTMITLLPAASPMHRLMMVAVAVHYRS